MYQSTPSTATHASERRRLATRRGRLLAVAGLALVGTGCATKGDLRDVQTEIRAMSARQDDLLAELRRQGRSTVDTLRTQSNQLVDLRGNVDQSLREILRELGTLRELTGENQRTLASVRDQVALLQRSVRTGVPPSDVGVAGEPGEADRSAERMYSAAMASFNRGSIRGAEVGFRNFIQQHPAHELTPLAHYHLADTYVQDGRFEEAVEEFSTIPERFPTSDRVPQALYRIGLLYLRDLDEPDEGRRYLQRVVNTYPDSPTAGLAQRALSESGGGVLH